MILWDKKKNLKLLAERGVSFDVFSELIVAEKYKCILKHPKREEQKIFIVCFNDYTYLVPFIVDSDDNIILKTIFPSRKYNKIYGVENEKK
jgi:uncharacterized DUF497 family protein